MSCPAISITKEDVVIRLLGAIVLAAGLVVALAAPAAAMPFVKVGIGGYGVANIPIVQDDSDPGPLFGIRGRLGLLSMLMIEPSITFFENKDATEENITFEAPEIRSYAFNLILKGGPTYATGGIGWSSVDIPDGAGKSDETTYNFGGGVEIGVGPVAVDVSPRLFIIETADKASRKNLALMAGINYYMF